MEIAIFLNFLDQARSALVDFSTHHLWVIAGIATVSCGVYFWLVSERDDMFAKFYFVVSVFFGVFLIDSVFKNFPQYADKTLFVAICLGLIVLVTNLNDSIDRAREEEHRKKLR